MRHRIGRLLSVAILVGAALAATPAVALGAPGASNPGGFSAIPAYSGSSFYICLLNSSTLCLESNGVTNQVTITSVAANWSVFTKKYLYGEVFNIENGNGNCLRENDSYEVVIANGGCLSSDIDGRWVWEQDASGNFTGVMHNDEYPADDMLVHGAVSGDYVWARPPVSGDWTKWSPPA